MKKSFYFLSITLLCALFSIPAQSQDADEIISNYFENIGGYENFGKLEGIKMMAKVNNQGMEIPIEIVQLKSGKQYTKVSVQGMTIMQGVFNGEILWGTNFQTMAPEQQDAETTEVYKKQANDFPDALYNYKEKGYTVELLGKETMDGAETFKLKVTMEPITIDGEEIENVAYYYFDTEAFVPIAQESEVKMGPQKGIIQLVKFSDYQEVDGLMFSFSMSQGVKDGPSQPIIIESIELNPEIDESIFEMPAEE